MTCTEQSVTLERQLGLISVPEAAGRLGVSRSYLSRLARTGQILALGQVRTTTTSRPMLRCPSGPAGGAVWIWAG